MQDPNKPFQEFLTAPAQPQTPNPTGMESPGIAAALIGKNFLDGLRQSRLQRAAQVEHENEKTQRSAETALHYLDTLKDVDPEVIGPYKNRIMQQYLQMIGSQKETSKDTGHPMTDMLKNMAINISGGPMPKQKGSIIDPVLINEAMMAAVDPNNSKYNRMAKAEADIANLAKETGYEDQRTIMADSRFIPLISTIRRLANNPDLIPNSIQSRPVDPFAATIEKFRMAGLKGMENGPSKSSGSISQDFTGIQQYIQRATDLKINFGLVKPTRSESKNVLVAGSNSPVMAEHYTGVPGHKDGWYSGDKLLENVQLAASVNPSTATQLVQSNAGPGKPLQWSIVNRMTQEVKPVVGKDGTGLFHYQNPSLQTMRSVDEMGGERTWKQWFDPSQAFSAPIPTQPQVNAVAPPQVNSAIPPTQAPTQVQPTAAVPTTPVSAKPKSGVGLLPQTSGVVTPPTQPVARPTSGGNITKLGVDPKWLDDRMANVMNGTESLEAIRKQMTGNQNTLGILEKQLSKRGITAHTEKQLDNINSVARMAMILPIYKELATLLPNEKNKVLQFVNGQIVTRTGAWTNPKVHDLIERINPELSNLARGISGEIRPTDADAQRMTGWGPKAGYNQEINLDRIKHFEEVLKSELKRHAGGASDEQLEAIIAKRNPALQGLFRVNTFRERANKK